MDLYKFFHENFKKIRPV